MPIVEFDEPPSWFLDVSETGEYKMPVGGGSVGVVGFILFPVSLASRDQDCDLSNPTIDIYNLTEKQ